MYIYTLDGFEKFVLCKEYSVFGLFKIFTNKLLNYHLIVVLYFLDG